MKILFLSLILVPLFSCNYTSKDFISFKQNNLSENNQETERIPMIHDENIFYHNSLVFNPGEYYLIEDNVNVYSQQNINSKILDSLKMHDKIIIIEDVHNEQKINGVNSCWYKIKFDQIIGYIWGGNIAKKTFIFDLDNNGIIDYFQYRISFAAANYYLDVRKDILIYLNEKKNNN